MTSSVRVDFLKHQLSILLDGKERDREIGSVSWKQRVFKESVLCIKGFDPI